MRRVLPRLLVLLTACVSFASLTPAMAHQVRHVTLYHDSNRQEPSGAIGLAPGDELEITITETIDWCYAYNLQTVAAAPKTAPEAGRLYTKDVVIHTTYHSDVSAYKVTIAPRESLAAAQRASCTLPSREFTIPIQNYGWSIGFAGGFTADSLTDPVYYLKASTQTVDGTNTPGYIVTRNNAAQDLAALGTTALIHLYNGDPDALRFLGGRWAPVTFGLSVGSSGSTKYYLGTSVHFDNNLYLTAGIAAGSVSRLPNGVREGDFVTSATSIDTPGRRTRAGLFLGVSYSFLGKGASSFSGAFDQPKPTSTQGDQGANTSTQGAGSTPSVASVSPLPIVTGTTIAITGQHFGSDKTAVKAYLVARDKSTPLTITDASDTTITAQVPVTDDVIADDAQLLVAVGTSTSAPLKSLKVVKKP